MLFYAYSRAVTPCLIFRHSPPKPVEPEFRRLSYRPALADSRVSGYRFDGIEGYVYPKTQAQPAGTVKLCRKYDVDRDDFMLFPGDQDNGCDASTDGDAGGNYVSVQGLSDWLGWVHPTQKPQAICSGGGTCSPLSTSLVMLLMLDD